MRGLPAAGLLLALALSVAPARAAAEGTPAFCLKGEHCRQGAVCVGGLCRVGEERGRVQVLHRLAVAPPLVVDLEAPDPAGGPGSPLGEEARRVGQWLASDLGWTGFYDLLPAHALPPAARQEGVSPSATNRLAWRALGVARVIKTSLLPAGDPGSYRLRIRAVEVGERASVDLPEGEVLVLPGGGRAATSRWVNALVAYDTGLAAAAGTRLVLSVQVRPGVKEVAAVAHDGGALSWITGNGSLNLSPGWGPHGAVGYMSYRSGNPDWLVDGKPLSTRPGLNAAGAWAPDGRLLALSVAEGENSDVVLIDGRTGTLRKRLTRHRAVDTSPAWSPDGRRLAFVSDRSGSPQIWLIGAGGEGLERFTAGGYVTSPEWSPDGSWIVFAHKVSGGFAILRKDLATRTSTRLTPKGVSAESPTISPDGRTIASVRRTPRDEPGPKTTLWLMDADGSRPRQVALPPLPVFAPSWER